MIPPPEVLYPFNPDTWGKTFDPQDKANHEESIINTHLTLLLVRWKAAKYTDEDLWEEFRESFEGWTLELLETATREVLKELRTYLVTHGVWVRRQAGSNSFARTLYEVLENEERYK
jgi:hypothetical protein